MARAARTGSVILAVLGALAIAPAIAQATISGQTQLTMPAAVTVGQTGVVATVTLTNADTGSDVATTNTVCNAGDPFPCPASGHGIALQPACSLLSGLTDCFPGDEDPTVFAVDPVAHGEIGYDCAGLTFDAAKDPMTGQLLVTPAETHVMLAGAGATCPIDLSLSVLAVPASDSNAGVAGTQTIQIASADQYVGSQSASSTETSETTVNPATPAIATTASGAITLGSGVLTDQATVSGRVNPVAGSTVTFSLYGPADTSCANPISETAAALSDGGTATSAPFTPTVAGTYRWIARYGGDHNNAAVGGSCGDATETVTVAAPVTPPPATPTIAIAASPGVILGGRVTATATVSGRVDPVAGSAVVFRLYGPDTAICANPIAAVSAPLSDNGIATSPPVAPPRPGGYRWVATYGGDAHNAAVATACGDPAARVAVTPLPAQILSAGFPSAPRVGEPVLLTVGALDPTEPISGVQATFGEPHGLSGISACRTHSFGVTVSPVRLQLPYTFRRAGRHKVTIVVLAGRCSGKPHRKSTTMTVDVAAAGAGPHSALRAAPLARAAASGCSNTFLRPGRSPISRVKVATAVLCLVNVERTKRGLKRLKASPNLASAARGHSADMLRRRFFDHAGPGGPSFQLRLARIRYHGTSAAENIGYGSSFSARLIVQAWMHSPPHRANILFPRSRFAGVGLAVGVPVIPRLPGSTYTMDFGSSLK